VKRRQRRSRLPVHRSLRPGFSLLGKPPGPGGFRRFSGRRAAGSRVPPPARQPGRRAATAGRAGPGRGVLGPPGGAGAGAGTGRAAPGSRGAAGLGGLGGLCFGFLCLACPPPLLGREGGKGGSHSTVALPAQVVCVRCRGPSRRCGRDVCPWSRLCLELVAPGEEPARLCFGLALLRPCERRPSARRRRLSRVRLAQQHASGAFLNGARPVGRQIVSRFRSGSYGLSGSSSGWRKMGQPPLRLRNDLFVCGSKAVACLGDVLGSGDLRFPCQRLIS